MISAKQLEKLTIDNSPLILTVVGVAGTITTALLTHKATVKSTLHLLEQDAEARANQEPALNRKEVFQHTWKYYIPPVTTGTVTIGAIVMANRIGTKRAAALASAYALSERAFSDYKSKVVEKIGERREGEIREDIVREQMQRNPQTADNTVIIGTGETLCYEMYTGRYFRSSVEDIKKAVNDTNYQINIDGYASVQDFYDRIGLPRTSMSEEVGWTSDKLMDVEITPIMSDDGRTPCVGINFTTGPVRDFFRFR